MTTVSGQNLPQCAVAVRQPSRIVHSGGAASQIVHVVDDFRFLWVPFCSESGVGDVEFPQERRLLRGKAPPRFSRHHHQGQAAVQEAIDVSLLCTTILRHWRELFLLNVRHVSMFPRCCCRVLSGIWTALRTPKVLFGLLFRSLRSL